MSRAACSSAAARRPKAPYRSGDASSYNLNRILRRMLSPLASCASWHMVARNRAPCRTLGNGIDGRARALSTSASAGRAAIACAHCACGDSATAARALKPSCSMALWPLAAQRSSVGTSPAATRLSGSESACSWRTRAAFARRSMS